MYKVYNNGKEVKGYLIESADFTDFNYSVRKKRLLKKDMGKVLDFCAYLPETAQFKVGLTVEEVLNFPWDNYKVPKRAYINKCEWVHHTSILLYKDNALVMSVSIDSDKMKVGLSGCNKFYVFYCKEGRVMLDSEAFVRNSLSAFPVIDSEHNEYNIIVPRLDITGHKGYSVIRFDLNSGEPVGIDSRNMKGSLLDYKPFTSDGISIEEFLRV